MSRLVVSPTASATVHTAESDCGQLPSFYFCCNTCGNCGKHRRLVEDAQADAVAHVTNHQPKEGQNAS